jgi:hypothetical protein
VAGEPSPADYNALTTSFTYSKGTAIFEWLNQYFSTFTDSRHYLGPKKFGGTPTWLKMTIVGTLCSKTSKKGSNSTNGGTPDTFLRDSGWKSLG